MPIFLKTTLSKQEGIASLPAVMALSVFILALVATVTAITFDENTAGLDQRQGLQALIYAETGAKDALIRIVRNKSYNCTATDCYALDLATNGCSAGTACAKITVSAGTGAAGDPKIITAKGISANNSRKIQINVTYDVNLNGQISSYTWVEQTN